MKKKWLGVLLSAMLAVGTLAGCGSSSDADASTETASTDKAAGAAEGGHINMAVSFWYEMDAHTDYNGWYTSMYGITETLFKANDSGEIEGWLAESGTAEGNVWTITLKDGVTFSNGNPVTSDVVIKNLQRVAEVNERGVTFASATFEAVDDKTFTITTPEVYPTMLDDLADPFTSIMDVDNITDYNTGIIATGPFTLTSYAVEDSVELAANENYWDGDVALDSASVFYIPDAATEAMSLQSGEIDMYINPDVDSVALFSADSNYTVASTPKTMIRTLIFNQENIPDANVRKAVAESIDKEGIEAILGGTDSLTEGAYSSESAYGAVTALPYDTADAESLLTEAGYTKNADGMFEKDGQPLTLRLAYYSARSNDKIATLMQDQLKDAGITIEMVSYDEPEGTYMSTGDFDLAVYYCSSSAGTDPYAFLNAELSSTGSMNSGKYSNPEVDTLLTEMATCTDADRRVEIATQVQQMAIDDVSVVYYAIPNKITVMKSTVTNAGETMPKDYYILNKDTAIS